MRLNSNNSMRLRNIFISAFTKGVVQARDDTWQSICEDFLEDQNDLKDKEDAVSYTHLTLPTNREV